MGAAFPLKIVPSRGGSGLPIQYVVPWTQLSPQCKRHLDQFSGFCKAHDRDRQTDRPPDRRTTLLGLQQ